MDCEKDTNQSESASSKNHVIGESCSIQDVVALRESLISDLNDCDELCLDLHKVEAVDTAGVQLLAAAVNSAKGSSSELKLVNPSDLFKDAVASLGLDEQFSFVYIESDLESVSGDQKSDEIEEEIVDGVVLCPVF